MNIILTGFKASGKSTLGLPLAMMTGRRFVDSDSLVERLAFEQFGEKLTCRELYKRWGAARMRDLETRALQSLAGRNNMVAATGGGSVLEEKNRTLLKRAGLCVFLDPPLAELEKRLADQADSPLFRDVSPAELYRRRYPLYVATADRRCATPEGAGPETCLRMLLETIGEGGC